MLLLHGTYNIFVLCAAWFWGDPHFTTLDGTLYTFNGLGEYVLLTATTSNNGTFVVQGRTQLAENTTATQFSAFAFGRPDQNASVTEVLFSYYSTPVQL